MKKIIFIIQFLIPIITLSQISFNATSKSYVLKNERFSVRYTLKGPMSEIKNPKFSYPNTDKFEIIDVNRSISTQTSITFINGKLTQTSEKTITWTVYMYAKQTGEFTIPPAKVEINGKTYSSNPVHITVGDNPNNPLPKPKQNPVFAQNNQENFQPQKNYTIKLFANKTTVYQGEPVYVYLKLFTVDYLEILNFKPGNAEGFWIQDFPQSSNISPQKQYINGKQYLTAILDKKLLFPQKVGDLKITPYTLKIQTYSYDPFFLVKIPDKVLNLTSNELVIHVKPLPEDNKPANFSGAVGNFNIYVQIDKTQYNIDEPVQIKVVISGTGNFGLFDDPQIQVPASFEKLQPSTSDNLTLTTQGWKGQKIYQFTFIPRAPGKYTIPPIEFSYFNPQTKSYITKKTDPIELEISGQIDTTQKYLAYSPQGQGIQQIATDIQYIETKKFKLQKLNNFIIENNWFWAIYIISILLFIITVILGKKYQKFISDTKALNFKKADKISNKILKAAYKSLKTNNLNQFYQNIDKALTKYASNKLNIPLKEFSIDILKSKLKEKQVPEDLINQYIKTLQISQQARYAPETLNIEPTELYQKSKKLISEIENHIK